jgi:hypothetical protein
MQRLVRGVLLLGVGLWIGVVQAWADEVQVTFQLEPGHEGVVVSWSATPLDLPPDADILSAMLMEPDPIDTPWQVALAPGNYLISAFSETDVYELSVTITDAQKDQLFSVPALDLAEQVAYHCTETPICRIDDADTGLSFVLPQGWGAEQPYFADLGNGEMAPEVSTVFFEEAEGDAAAVWFLNPLDWIEDDNGPCLQVSIGTMCSFEIGPVAQAGFDVIAPSLVVGPSAP